VTKTLPEQFVAAALQRGPIANPKEPVIYPKLAATWRVGRWAICSGCGPSFQMVYTLQASKSEACLAIDLYNRSSSERSLEGFIVHMNLAWLYLLHARFMRPA
jgi:hypothetical protein